MVKKTLFCGLAGGWLTKTLVGFDTKRYRDIGDRISECIINNRLYRFRPGAGVAHSVDTIAAQQLCRCAGIRYDRKRRTWSDRGIFDLYFDFVEQDLRRIVILCVAV